tara:strand:- start:2140 stop:3063 length:924 start_codon:yes stop_codon:yes gene_type:complete
MDNLDNISNKKNAKKYTCEKCNFTCSKLSNFNAHLATSKHKRIISGEEKMPKNALTVYVCDCGSSYKYMSGLCKHRNKCYFINKKENEKNEKKEENEENEEEILNDDINYKDLLLKAMNQLQDQQEELKRKDEIMEKMIDKMGTTTNNNIINNTNNNILNIQLFLNETCKDALNIMDFVDSLQLQLHDLENTGKLGFVEGTTKIFLDGLKQLDIRQRPIHCTDLKKETVYIKDDDEWKEDVAKEKIKMAIDEVNDKNLKQMANWIEENPNKSDELELIVQNIANPDIDKESNKIIKNISKQVIIPTE